MKSRYGPLYESVTVAIYTAAALVMILAPVFNRPRGCGGQISASRNLRQIGLAVLMYAQDYNDHLPPLTDGATAKAMLLPYIGRETVFDDPTSRRPFRPNRMLSARRFSMNRGFVRLGSGVERPVDQVAVYFEAAPREDGRRGVLFLDGHVKRVDPAEWEHIKTLSAIRE